MKRFTFIVSVLLIFLSVWACSVKENKDDMIPKEGEIQVSFELVSNDIAESAKFLAKFITVKTAAFVHGIPLNDFIWMIENAINRKEFANTIK